jgi:hypothetical protein
MLRDVNSNSSGRDLASEVGNVEVQYGERSADEDAETGRLLTFAESEKIRRPAQGMLFER